MLLQHTGDWGDSVSNSGVRWISRRRQRLSWQCKNCTEALKTGCRRKLKRVAPGRGGGKVTEESAGQPPRSSARVGPGAGREEGVTQQRCRARLQRGEDRARAAWRWNVAFRIQLCPPARWPGLPHVCPHLHKYAAVRWDLEWPCAALERVLCVRQLEMEKGSTQPRTGRPWEGGRWRVRRSSTGVQAAPYTLKQVIQSPRLLWKMLRGKFTHWSPRSAQVGHQL